MAHTYVLISATTLDDLCTITGTVDGVFASFQVWASYVTSLPNNQAIKNYLAPLALAAAFPPQPTTQANIPLGTFTQ